MCLISKVTGIKKEKYVQVSEKEYTDVREQIWLPNVKYLWIAENSS